MDIHRRRRVNSLRGPGVPLVLPHAEEEDEEEKTEEDVEEEKRAEEDVDEEGV